ncbi:MAG: tetratricopeptide repeat protein [Lewinellaceae bacterium]|nr:tetratricopeptide repeat protein [Lewinellaceae bacterium]
MGALSSLYINLGQYQQALEAAQQALAAAPDVENALLYEGLAISQPGYQPQRALGSFERLVRVNEEYYAAYYYIGLVYESTQNYRYRLR